MFFYVFVCLCVPQVVVAVVVVVFVLSNRSSSCVWQIVFTSNMYLQCILVAEATF